MLVLKLTRAQPCISHTVAAQSGGSLVAVAATQSTAESFGVSTEGERRLRAAALRPDVNDVKPDPGVWS